MSEHSDRRVHNDSLCEWSASFFVGAAHAWVDLDLDLRFRQFRIGCPLRPGGGWLIVEVNQ